MQKFNSKNKKQNAKMELNFIWKNKIHHWKKIYRIIDISLSIYYKSRSIYIKADKILKGLSDRKKAEKLQFFWKMHK